VSAMAAESVFPPPGPRRDAVARAGSALALVREAHPGDGRVPVGVRVHMHLEFAPDVRPDPRPDRLRTTLLFTDIVGATRLVAELGDRRWRELLERHHAVVRRELSRFGGREIDTAGDGFLATVDDPAQAVRCACAIRDAVRRLGIAIRAGVHTGECEPMGEKVVGIAVHIGARVAASAGAGEILVSSAVRDQVVGSEIRFEGRATQVLKGVPGEWRLFAVRRGWPAQSTLRGSSASRRPSPMKLMERTVRKIAVPGKMAQWGAKSRLSLASKRMRPHVGMSGGNPSPRNDSDDSAMIAVATSRVPATITGPTAFGRMCRTT